MSYTDFQKNYNTGKQVYLGLNTTSESRSACSTFRYLYIQSFFIVKQKTVALEQKIAEIKNKYLPSTANPMIQDLRKTYDDEVKSIQSKLSDKLAAALDAKRNACRKYTMIPPSADQLALLQTIQLRGVENIPEEEWNMMIQTLAGNHQAAGVLESLAKDSGKEFKAPFSAADALRDLENFQNRAEIAISNITDPYKDGRAYEFFRDDIKDSLTSELINKLDSEIGTAVPDKSLTIAGRLDEAAEKALKAGNFDEFQLIHNFRFSHSSVFESPDETNQSIINQAEELIELGMSTKEKGKDPIADYNMHRDMYLEMAKKLGVLSD